VIIFREAILFPLRVSRVWHRLLKCAKLGEKSEKWFKLHVYTLKKYFRSNAVGVDPIYKETWMKHKTGYLDESYFRPKSSNTWLNIEKPSTTVSV